ncbi:Vesicle-associated protein 1-3, partial [Bienertia sinuspersici]
MNTGDLLHIEPTELRFSFELRKQSSCYMTLTNKTEQYVAFKKYCVRLNTGVVLPGATCDVTVTMQAQKEALPGMQCKDKFLVQSAVAPDGCTTKDITSEMFNKDDGKVVEEFKLRVIFVPANPPSPVPEESEEGSPPRDDGHEQPSLASAVSGFIIFSVGPSVHVDIHITLRFLRRREICGTVVVGRQSYYTATAVGDEHGDKEGGGGRDDGGGLNKKKRRYRDDSYGCGGGNSGKGILRRGVRVDNGGLSKKMRRYGDDSYGYGVAK